MERKKFDLAVIGAGPGGYVAAIKASQKGKKVVLIEKEYLGGTCLNVGCIPTKTLLANANLMQKISHASDFGIHIGSVSLDFKKMKERKDTVVEKIRKSLEGLILSNSITILRGSAEFLSPREIKIKGADSEMIYAENTIIASGSKPLDIGGIVCDHQRIFNSSSILSLTELPKSIAIIGGGYIGCEFASLYHELGVKVIILEALPTILALQGKTVADFMTKTFTKKGMEIHTNVFVEAVEASPSSVSIKLRGKDPITADIALVAIGRKIVSDGLGLEKAGVRTNEKGAILVNEKMETNVPGIYAIGDVTGQLLLAHVASHQGIIAAENITGGQVTMHYNAVPAVIFTMPEVAAVGMTEEQAKEAGHDVAIGKFPFQALGKSVAIMETEGFAQVISDRKTQQILGAVAIGYDASSLISEIALAMTNELTVDCISETIHAHPTLPEAWLEAALLATDTPIHFPPKVKK